MPDPREAYLAMMGAGQGAPQAAPQMPPQAPPQMPAPIAPENPMSDPAEEQEFIDQLSVDTDPTSQEEDTYFADPDFFPNTPKKGDKVKITMTVQSVGSKIGLTPSGVEDIPMDDDEDDEDEDY